MQTADNPHFSCSHQARQKRRVRQFKAHSNGMALEINVDPEHDRCINLQHVEIRHRNSEILHRLCQQSNTGPLRSLDVDLEVEFNQRLGDML